MEFKTEIDEKANLRKHTVRGNLTMQDIFDELQRVYSEPGFRADIDVLWDLREARVTTMTSAEVEKLSDFVASHWGPAGKSRAALVVSRDFEFGITRMYEIFLESRMSATVRVFRDMEEALAWMKS